MGLLAEAREKQKTEASRPGLLAEARAKQAQPEPDQTQSAPIAPQKKLTEPGLPQFSNDYRGREQYDLSRLPQIEAKQRTRELIPQQLEQYKAGGLNSKDVTLERMEEIRAARIEQIPELTGSFKELSKKLGFAQALAGMTTFNEDEFGKILQSADPSIGIVTTPEGERLAINRRTNEMMSINKVGPSLIDAIQFGGAMASFSPAGRLQGIGRQMIGSAATQGAIEVGQKTAGGEFNPGDVAITAAAVPVVAGALKSGSYGLKKLSQSLRGSRSLIDQTSGLPVPEFEKALKKRGIDFGSLIDDADNLPVINSSAPPDEVVDEIIKEQLRTGNRSSYLYKYRLAGDKIVDDDVGIEAVRQGIKEGEVAQIKGMGRETKLKASKMLNMQRQITSNKANAQNFRPTDVVGDVAIDTVNALDNKAQNLRAELDRIAEKELRGSPNTLPSPDKITGKKINLENIENTFKSHLDDLNVSYKTGLNAPPLFEQINQKGFFNGSDIMEDKSSQGVIKAVTRLLSDPGRNDAWRAHKVKTQIDKMVDYKKSHIRGITPTGQRFAKAMRATLNDEIREVSPRYAQVNDQLSSILRSFDDMQSAVGPNVRLFEPDANRQLGQTYRALWSKNQKRGALQSAVDNLADTAESLGIKTKTNVKDLSQFAVTLENTFGDVAETGFKQEVSSGVNLSLKPTAAALKFAENTLGKKYAELRNINDTQRFNVMTELLKRGN